MLRFLVVAVLATATLTSVSAEEAIHQSPMMAMTLPDAPKRLWMDQALNHILSGVAIETGRSAATSTPEPSPR